MSSYFRALWVTEKSQSSSSRSSHFIWRAKTNTIGERRHGCCRLNSGCKAWTPRVQRGRRTFWTKESQNWLLGMHVTWTAPPPPPDRLDLSGNKEGTGFLWGFPGCAENNVIMRKMVPSTPLTLVRCLTYTCTHRDINSKEYMILPRLVLLSRGYTVPFRAFWYLTASCVFYKIERGSKLDNQ